MTKRTITRTWLAGLAVVLAGGLVSGVSLAVWLTHVTAVTRGGSRYVADGFFWTVMAFIWAGGIIAAGGVIIQVAAWISALRNTRRLADRSWFTLLLWVGIVGIVTSPLFGLGVLIFWGVTIAYLIGGPDQTAVGQPRPATPTAPARIPGKRMVTSWWIGGTVAMLAGGSAALVVSYATAPGNVLHGRTAPSVALLMVSISVAAIGVFTQLVAWTAAVLNTHLVVDRTWFYVLPWVGIPAILASPIVVGGLVWWGLMLAYVVGGPDGTAVGRPPLPTPAAAPPTLVPTS
jgi:hypothetical protein